MSWVLRAESNHTVEVTHESVRAFRDALLQLLEGNPDDIRIHVHGPISAALGDAINVVRHSHGEGFRIHHRPPNAQPARPAPAELAPQEPEYHNLLKEIRRRASLVEAFGGVHHDHLNRDVNDFRRRFPLANRALGNALDDGRNQGQARLELGHLIERHGPESQAVNDFLRGLIKRWPAARRSYQGIVDRALAASGNTILKPTTHDHRPFHLTPSPIWHIYIDETGSDFDARSRSSIWAVVVPDHLFSTLARPSAAFHAVSEPGPVIDRVLADLVAHPIGFIGVEARAFAPISDPVRRWLAGVTELIDWLIRLVPLTSTGRTRLIIHVEQRGNHPAGEVWEALPTALLAQLSRYHPARADRLDIDPIAVQAKNAEGAWVDAIAHTWGGTGVEAENRRRILQLERFMVGPSGFDLRRLFDLGLGLGDPPVAIWRRLVHAAPAYPSAHLIHHLLERLATTTRDDEPLWRRLLAATVQDLHATDVDIGRLGLEIGWLDHAVPPASALNAPARLAWALTVLAEENQAGELADDDLFGAIEHLTSMLFDEDPGLVALADLHVAVTHTNRFDFDRATAVLARWNTLPVAIGGLRVHGRVQSSLGQHAAFRGEHNLAEQHFLAAIGLFSRLSDPRSSAPDLEKTRIHRAINAMDTPDLPDATVVARLEEALEQPLLDAAHQLAAAPVQAKRFLLHAICRFAATERAPAEALREILCTFAATPAESASNENLAPAGFPWQLIWHYRSRFFASRGLVHKAEAALAASRRAFAGIPDAGPTLRLIDLTLEAAALDAGAALQRPELADEIATLRENLPAAADRIARLEAWLARSGGDPDLIMKTVLPFNFR